MAIQQLCLFVAALSLHQKATDMCLFIIYYTYVSCLFFFFYECPWLFIRECGIIDALEDAGVNEGDTVNILDIEFDFVP